MAADDEVIFSELADAALAKLIPGDDARMTTRLWIRWNWRPSRAPRQGARRARAFPSRDLWVDVISAGVELRLLVEVTSHKTTVWTIARTSR